MKCKNTHSTYFYTKLAARKDRFPQPLQIPLCRSILQRKHLNTVLVQRSPSMFADTRYRSLGTLRFQHKWEISLKLLSFFFLLCNKFLILTTRCCTKKEKCAYNKGEHFGGILLADEVDSTKVLVDTVIKPAKLYLNSQSVQNRIFYRNLTPKNN